MRIHTQGFKDEIKNFARQINGRIYYYSNYNLIDESNNNILTEDNIQLISEQFNKSGKTEINNELIYSMDIIKNGQLLQSLMKEFDFNAKTDLKIGTVVNAQLGLLVNNDYEYLNYGDYIIYSKQYNADTETYSYVCYDMMLYSMIKYKPLNITYPTTIKDLISAIADKMGVGFANINDNFANYNQVVEKDLFVNQNVTYRDILDKLSEVTASNILINDNNELELGYPNETNDTINESYLKDVNVAFNETFGPINKVAITIDSISYVKQDDASIETNGLTQINITNNLLALNGDTDTICQAILNKLNGLYYSINDFTTTGVCYYDYLDLFNVEARSNTYKCLLLNNEIHITQGIQENIFTQKKENTETSTNNFEVSTPDNKTVQFNINQQKGELESKVDKDGVISSINQSAEQIQINANKISLAGKTINMTSDNIEINSDNFNVDKDGNMTCINANVTGTITSANATITGGSITIDTSRWTDGININNSQDDEEVIIRGGSLQFGLSNIFSIEMASNYFNQGGYLAIKSLNNGYLAVENNVLNFYNSSSNRKLYINGNDGTLQATNLYVSGTKNRVVEISNNKQVLLNAYETATPYFGDIGSNKTDKNGYCKIEIENIFSETIEDDDYKVFIQECGEGHLYVEKHNNYFEVKGTPDLNFDWELKAIQKGYKNVRLEEKENK